MSPSVDIPLSHIFQHKDARKIDRAAVQALGASIAEIGIINPIRVRPACRLVVGEMTDAYECIAGNHRIAAARLLGLDNVPCIVVEEDDLHAELAMIDENLCRANLSPTERSVQMARRKAIYEELHPETAHGGDRKSSRKVGNSNKGARFTVVTAEATGRSERAVQLDAERGEKVIPEVLTLLAETPLDTGTYLDRIKNLPPNEQVFATRRDLAELRRRESQPKPVGRKRDHNIETFESWRDAFLRVWDRGSQEWRERIMAEAGA